MRLAGCLTNCLEPIKDEHSAYGMLCTNIRTVMLGAWIRYIIPPFHDADHKPISALGVASRQKSVKDLIKDPRIMAQCGIHPTLLPPVSSDGTLGPHPTFSFPPYSRPVLIPFRSRPT